MGNYPRFRKYIQIEEISYLTLNHSDKFWRIFSMYQNSNGVIPWDSFMNWINRQNDPKLSKRLFHIFSKSQTTMTLDEWKWFYAAFNSRFKRHKIELIAEIIFGKGLDKDQSKWWKRLSLYFKEIDFEKIFDDKEWYKSISNKKNKLLKQKFIDLCAGKNYFKYFVFIKTVYNSSFFSLEEKMKYFNLWKVNYECDCLTVKSSTNSQVQVNGQRVQEKKGLIQSIKKVITDVTHVGNNYKNYNQQSKNETQTTSISSTERSTQTGENITKENHQQNQQNQGEERKSVVDIKEELNNKYKICFREIRDIFNYFTKNKNHLLPLDQLEIMWTDLKVKQSIVTWVISYFKLWTDKMFITFEIFEKFCLQTRLTLDTNEKMDFFFTMISYPNTSIPKAKIEKILNISLSSIHDSLIKKETFLNPTADSTWHDAILSLLPSIDKIGLLPYIKFNLQPIEISVYRKIVLHILDETTISEYLKLYFSKEKYFYAINSEFWHKLTSNAYDENDIPSRINNSSICKNGNLLNKTQCKYERDYFIIPESLYMKIKNWFHIINQVKFTKHVFQRKIEGNEGEINKEQRSNFIVDSENGYIRNRITDDNNIETNEELDWHPIQVIFVSFDNIIRCTKKERPNWNDFLTYLKDFIHDDFEGKYGRYFITFRRNDTFLEVKNFIQVKYKLDSDKFKWWIYNNERLYQPSNDKSFEEEKVFLCSMILVDLFNEKNNCFDYDLLEAVLTRDATDDNLVDEGKQHQDETVKENEDKNVEKTTNKNIKTKDNETNEKGNNPTDHVKSKDQKSESSNKTDKVNKGKVSKMTGIIQNEPEEDILTLPFGLPNLGNTCYFNSVNQIFLNLFPWQQILFNPMIKYFINKKNKFGQKGKIIHAFQKLFNQTQSKVAKSITNFNDIIGKINDQFNNNEQQDANEYLIFLLETFHEELNLKSERRYIENKDPNPNNTEEELSNLSWANSMRRGSSFINSWFMFQLKSNLICLECQRQKISYETNYIIDLPIALVKIIKIEIVLHRLPFNYKIYYSDINTNFKDYCDSNVDRSIPENWEQFYYDSDTKYNELYQSPMNVMFPVTLKMDISRNSSVGNLLTILRKITDWELEPNKIREEIINEDIIEYNFDELTTFLVTNSKGMTWNNDFVIENCIGGDDHWTWNVYELLNSKGIINVFKSKEYQNYTVNILSYKRKQNVDFVECITNMRNRDCNDKGIKQEEKILNIWSWSDNITLSSKAKDNNTSIIDNSVIVEFSIPIYHFHVGLSRNCHYLFNQNAYERLRIPMQYILVNNSDVTFTSRELYEYIWSLNKKYFKYPNKLNHDIWWRYDISKLNKKCYPFVLRYNNSVSKNENKLSCGRCPWYSFCPGCIIDPYDINRCLINPNESIIVEWCNSAVRDEMSDIFVHLSFIADNEKIKQFIIMNNIEIDAENKVNKNKTIYDCFELFCEKEKLEDMIYCNTCLTHRLFTKNYEISKWPHVWILSLKRFKYTNIITNKLTHFISYPLTDMNWKGKVYDWYGVINHYGNITHGHYTSIVKTLDNKWMMCDDLQVYQINEKQVVTPNAYIWIYVAKEQIQNNNQYYKILFSILSTLNEEGGKKIIKKDNNNYYAMEPVTTPYGDGYVMKDSLSEDNECLVEVKFEFGKGRLQ